MIGIDEHFFTPTVERHRQEQGHYEEVKRKLDRYYTSSYSLAHLYKSSRSSRQASEIAGSRDIIQRRQRQPSVGLRDLSDGLVIRGSEQLPPTSDMIRRVSAPHISPFKSHSLSSSPQAAEYYRKFMKHGKRENYAMLTYHSFRWERHTRIIRR